MEKNYHVYAHKEAFLLSKIGLVVHLWAALENELLHWAAWGVQTDVKSAAKLTSSFKSFSLSLDFTQTACKIRLADQTYFNSLVELIRESSGDRNFVAHTQIASHGNGHPAETDWALVEPHVGPALRDYLLQAPPKREPMDLHEVAEIAHDIQFLVERLIEFRLLLETGDAWPDKFQRPIASRRPRLSERRAKNHKVSGPPPELYRK